MPHPNNKLLSLLLNNCICLFGQIIGQKITSKSKEKFGDIFCNHFVHLQQNDCKYVTKTLSMKLWPTVPNSANRLCGSLSKYQLRNHIVFSFHIITLSLSIYPSYLLYFHLKKLASISYFSGYTSQLHGSGLTTLKMQPAI